MVAGFIVRTTYGYYTVGGRGQYWTLEEARRVWRERRRMAAAEYDRLMQRIASRFGSKEIPKAGMKKFLPPPKLKPKPEPKPNKLSPPFSILMFPEPTILYTETPMGITKRPVKRYTKRKRASKKQRKTRKTRRRRVKPSGIVHDMFSLIL